MTPQNTAFRSKIEREKEVDLLKMYRAIGIPAIAAASGAIRRPANTSTPPRVMKIAYAD